MPPKKIVYLAGPVSNCNDSQKRKWRQEIRSELGSAAFEFIDPTDHEGRWDPKMEMVEIDRSDLVIANLWRESIGTVVGIVQARRRGKPVILIDQNYLDSVVLKRFVGDTMIVRSIPAAINKLKADVLPMLDTDLDVTKKKQKTEQFSFSKLQRSLNAVCEEAGVSDAYLPILVTQRALKELKAGMRAKKVSTSDIREAVFKVLQTMTLDDDQLYPLELKRSAKKMIEQWEEQELVKGDRRELQGLKVENVQLAEDLRESHDLVATLQQTIKEMSCVSGLQAAAESPSRLPTSILEALQMAQATYPLELVVHEKATHSAGECPYKDPVKMLHAVELLVKYAQAVKCGLTGELSKWLKSNGCSFEYATGESETTRNDPSAKKERTVVYRGKPLLLLKHLKAGQARIHFEFVDNGRVLVGHVGSHLRLAAKAY